MNQYIEHTEPVTEYFHDNKKLNHRYINKRKNTTKTLEWDSCGRLIRKSKSGKTLFRNTEYYKTKFIEYHINGQVKMKLNAKLVGCFRVKKSRKKIYSKDGNRLRQ